MADFGHAIAEMKAGKKVSRFEWVGNTCIFLDEHPVPRLNAEHADMRGRACSPAICKVEEDGSITIGWSPSVIEMLAEDWFIHLTM
jgi:hypothetical protein